MPTPETKESSSSKSKKSAEQSQGSLSPFEQGECIRHIFASDTDSQHGWNTISAALCLLYGLPDLTTRSGFKQLHSQFDAMYRKLDKELKSHVNEIRIRGGIIMTYTFMAADSVLRKKLVERGLLQQLSELLYESAARHVSVRGLYVTVYYEDLDAREEVAKHANAIVRIMRTHPDDHALVRQCALLLLVTVGRICDGRAGAPNPDTVACIDMPLLIRTFIEATKKPGESAPYVTETAIRLFSMAMRHFSKLFLDNMDAIDLVVAGLRSKNWTIRCLSLSALFNLYMLEGENEPSTTDPMVLIHSVGNPMPPHLSRILDLAGLDRSEIRARLKAMVDCIKVTGACKSPSQFYELGLKFVPIILSTEFSIMTAFTASGGPIFPELPGILTFADAMPLCAQAIRNKNKNAQELDAADIIDLKYLLMKQKLDDAIRKAKECLQRNPLCAYFHYVVSLSPDAVEGLRAAKRGLMCKDASLTPFVRCQMLFKAVEHAGDMAILLFHVENPETGDQRRTECIAFLMSAAEDAKKFAAEAPPDARHMKTVLPWHIMLTILTRDEVSRDLRELQGTLEQLRVADDFSRFIGAPIFRTQTRLSQDLIVKRYRSALESFASVIQRCDETFNTTESPTPAEHDSRTGLDHWMSNDAGDIYSSVREVAIARSRTTPRAYFPNVTLFSMCKDNIL